MTARLAIVLLMLLPLTGMVRGQEADPELEKWIAELESEEFRDRWYAAERLAWLGPRAAPAAEPLVRALADGVAGRYVEDALFAIGEAAIPPLLEGLGGPDSDLSTACARVLGRIGPRASEAIEVLGRRAGNPDEPGRDELLGALSRIDPGDASVPGELLVLAKSGSLTALRALAERADGSVTSMLELLAEGPADIRGRVADELLSLTDLLPAHVDRLARLLASQEQEVRRWAAVLLAHADPGATDLLAGLADALRGEGTPRYRALTALAALGPRARALFDLAKMALPPCPSVETIDAVLSLEPPATPSLGLLLELVARPQKFGRSNRAWAGRDHAALLLSKRGEEARAAIPILIAALSEPWTQEVHIGATLRLNRRFGHPFAAEALGGFGPLATDAVPALEKAFSGIGMIHDLDVAILRALGAIGSAAAPALARLEPKERDLELELLVARARADPEGEDRAANVIGAIRAGSEFPLIMCRPYLGLPEVFPDDPLLPALRVGSETGSPGMRIACARLVHEVTGSHGPAADLLVSFLEHPDPEVRLTAAMELARSRTEVDRALAVFRGFLADYVEGEIFHVPVILRALEELGPLGAPAAPEVAAAAHGPWDVYCLPALRCLARLGPHASPPRDQVEAFLVHPDRKIRAAARAALR